MEPNNNNNNSSPQSPGPNPEQVVAFFVPNHVAGYVTEVLELALGHMNGINVSAGTLKGLPKSNGVPLSYLRNPDGAALPDFDINPPITDIRTQTSAKPKTKTLVMPRSKFFRWKKFKKLGRSTMKKTFPETDFHCCPQKMAKKLEDKYGPPVPNLLNGTASAPRLMIQYPDLPYMVPVTQNFKDVGVPRNVVDFCYNAVFTADTSNEHLPILRSP